jgi:branched-chain amino acid aminotransferase
MSLKVYIDGQLLDKDDAKVSVYDHGLLYGDGVFEGIRAYHGKVFEFDAHLRRLWDSAKSIRLEIPISMQEMREAIERTIAANGFEDCYLRVVVTRGAGDLGLDPRKSVRPCVIVIADKLAVYPPEMYEKGMAVITANTIRNHPQACPPRVKSLNYLNNILAKIEAIDAGVLEAVMMNHVGNVAECTADNIFIVRWGRVLTPQVTDGILEGVTRQVIIDLCRKLNVPLLEVSLQKHDLYVADEMFVTGTGAEVMPVTKIDGRTIGDGSVGPITRQLLAAFRAHIRESASRAH